jgi:parallel beta-helix repeat protein
MMKTLQQVEPRTPISSLPFTITEPGSYYFTTNLDAAGGSGITISASEVTVDLMGFALANGVGSGISLAGFRTNIWIKNGAVRGWGSWGVNVALARGSTLENIRASRNGSSSVFGGLRVGSASIVRNCAADENTGPGIHTSGERNRIEGNHVTSNDRGIAATGVNNIIIRNTASGNVVDYEILNGNDLGPIGSAATLSSPWGNIGILLFDLTVVKMGVGSGTVTSMSAGINCGPDCTESYPQGATVVLNAAADPGYVFAGWSGGGCSGTGACMVTMDSAKTVVATFNPATQPLTVSKAGTGAGAVTSSPAGINCGVDCTEDYLQGTMVSLTAAANNGSTFSGWSGACTGTGGCTVTMDAAKSVTATFTLNTFTLTVNKSGSGLGTVASSPAGINCGADCSEPYNNGTVVTLSAAPGPNSTFQGWSGGGCSGTGNCTVTVTAATTVTAFFSTP